MFLADNDDKKDGEKMYLTYASGMDWDINYIIQVIKVYDKVSRGFEYQKQKLQGNISNKSLIEQF